MTDPFAPPTRAEYTAWLAKVEAARRTPPLEEYAYWLQFDSNLPWVLDAGHLVNLLDVALEKIEELSNEQMAVQVGGEYQRGYEHATAAYTNEILQLREELRVARESPQEDTGATGVSENP